MTSSETAKPSYFRRLVGLAIFIVLLFGGYSAAWFYFGGLVEDQAKAVLAQANQGNRKVECDAPTARGFPFRIGLYCDHILVEDGDGARLEAGALRTAAQVYNPFHVVGELDGPATVRSPEGVELSLSWNALRASVRLDTPLPERISVEGNGLTAAITSGAKLFDAKSFEGHARPAGEGLDLAASFDGLAADPGLNLGTLPPLAGNIDLTLPKGVALLQSESKSLRGQSANVRALDVSVDPSTGVGVVGTISADENGLIDAELTLAIRNPRGLAEVVAKAAPAQAEQIRATMTGLAALGDNPTLPLRIVKGKAMLGFIPLGDIPPL